MNVFHCRQSILYDGSQLRSHWLYEQFGLVGDTIAYFTGPCDVKPELVVDVVDRRYGHPIRAASMLHFICEHFDPDIGRAVLRQRLLVAVAYEALSQQAEAPVRREGDDLYIDGRKLSVAVATVSPVSALIHFGVNIDPSGAPVDAIGLAELGVDAEELGEAIAHRYADEIRQVAAACCTVRWVR
ncbi:MAG: DUF366 family protein [Armatimonadetes bacterium]|nr:DUF366 family protein [Armatimonadota bacterium]